MRFRVSLFKVFLAFLLLSASWSLYRMMAVSGESNAPKTALIRLEDVGPGGEYGSMEQLGKLRAVLEYLRDEGVRFQIGVIPKWVNYSGEGLIYNKSIDQLNDPYVAAFVKLLHDAGQEGAVIGMHGYTHQAGEVKRADGHQESGIGNEMNEPGMPETSTREFAESRIKQGLGLFSAAGLDPLFWETPHYHSAPAQHEVFRSYFGIIYENSPNQPGQSGLYIDPSRNKGFGSPSWGTAYVPTPFSYIPYDKDERLILDQLGKTDRLPSFFYHAFLEFKHLIPVLDEEGNPVLRDGLPEYKYPDKSKTNLQRLVAGFRDREYQFISLADYVPFVPAAEFNTGADEGGMKLADVDGDGQLDAVTWKNGGAVTVVPGIYGGRRNDPHPSAAGWASIPRNKGDVYALKDENGDGKADLWIVRADGRLELYRSTGASFRLLRSWMLPQGAPLEDAEMLKRLDGTFVLAGVAANGSELVPYWMQRGGWKRGESAQSRAGAFREMQLVRSPVTGAEQLARCRKDNGVCYRFELHSGKSKWSMSREETGLSLTGDELKLADFNGDGLEDVLMWDRSGRMLTVYRGTADGSLYKLSSFGPWGEPGAKLMIADLNGDGKTDIAALEPDGRLDTALSYQTTDFVK